MQTPILTLVLGAKKVRTFSWGEHGSFVRRILQRFDLDCSTEATARSSMTLSSCSATRSVTTRKGPASTRTPSRLRRRSRRNCKVCRLWASRLSEQGNLGKTLFRLRLNGFLKNLLSSFSRCTKEADSTLFRRRPGRKPGGATGSSPLSLKLQDLHSTLLNYKDHRGRVLSTPFVVLPSKTVSSTSCGHVRQCSASWLAVVWWMCNLIGHEWGLLE